MEIFPIWFETIARGANEIIHILLSYRINRCICKIRISLHVELGWWEDTKLHAFDM